MEEIVIHPRCAGRKQMISKAAFGLWNSVTARQGTLAEGELIS